MDAAAELEAIAARCRRDPVWKAEHLFGFTPWSKQAEILRSVREHRRTAVRSCNGVGKTATAAIACLDFITLHPHSRVITTAPIWQQVKHLLWREIRTRCAIANQGPIPLGAVPTETKLELADDWFALGLSTNQPERFAGHHAEHLLLIVDEASGVDEAIYEAGEGFLTAEGARVLLIGNPTQLAGQFHRAFHSERSNWNVIHISALESPNFTDEVVPPSVAKRLVTPAWVEEKQRTWGESSPAYQVRVLGEFPSTADDTVCSLAAVEAAQRYEVPDIEFDGDPELVKLVSCDVARFGSDETVIVTRVGQRVRIRKTYTGQDLMSTVGWCIDAAKAIDTRRIRIDDAGLGGGVTDRLREQGYFVEAFNAADTPTDPLDWDGHKTYPNKRSEAWFAFRDQLPHIDLDADEQLLGDLVAPLYKMDSAGRRVVEPKHETKKRLGRSPDRADAVLMAFAPFQVGESFRVPSPWG